MKTNRFNVRANQGFALWIYLSLLGISIAGLAGIMSYSMSSANQTARNNEFLTTTYIAESAAEKIRAYMQSDNIWGEQYVDGRLANYPAKTLSSADSPLFGGYAFSTPLVARTASKAPVPLEAPFLGYTNYAHIYQIIVTASNINSQFKVPVTVGMEVIMSSMSLFHNAVFYGPKMDLEINPGADMTIKGTVYGGGNIYIDPNTNANLTFNGDVASFGSINKFKSPKDPTSSSGSSRPAIGTAAFNGRSGLSLSNSPTLTLPLGTNQAIGDNSPDAIYAILQPPVTGEDMTGPIGTNRYYNKADLILTITDSNIVARSATHPSSVVLNNFSTNNIVTNNIVRTNDCFYDKREGKYAKTTTIDVGLLRGYATNNTELYAANNFRYINTLYVVDLRSTNNPAQTNYLTNATNAMTAQFEYAKCGFPWILTNKPVSNGVTHVVTTNYYCYHTNTFASFPAVTLTNGWFLPDGGLTVVTPDPVYVIGNYNVSKNGTSTSAGTAVVTNTRPGAIMCDAITILSSNWNNAQSANAISNRTAANTTVNAAFVAGNVPSDSLKYSGGLENFPRFLEDWTGKTFTYNGSMVCLFPSQIAKQPWLGTGTTFDIYNPPTRAWAFDTNFLGEVSSLPPSAPSSVASSKGRWAILPPGATNF